LTTLLQALSAEGDDTPIGIEAGRNDETPEGGVASSLDLGHDRSTM
jgi:hypothetical protein